MTGSFEFLALASSHLIAAFTCPVLDCDEVFNYWEPLHHLVHGHGLQTWEYSGQFALRSYLYLLLHAPIVAVAGAASSAFAPNSTRVAGFFALRAVLALATAACEAHWLGAIQRRIGKKAQRWTLFFLVLSPGTFIASAAFIPSSFAMCCMTLVQSFQLRGNAFVAILAGAAAGVVGWPFCVVALLPAGVDLLLKFGLLRCIAYGIVALGATALPAIWADTYYYLHPATEGVSSGYVFSTWNVLLYNMMPRGTGSELYGVEEWHFYLRNLALNFNLALPCALMAPFAAGLLAMTSRVHSRRSRLPDAAERLREVSDLCIATALWVSPFPLWLGMFSLIPHKEERFMFVIYPQLCLGAAVTLTCMETGLFGTAVPSRPSSARRTFSSHSATHTSEGLGVCVADEAKPFGSCFTQHPPANKGFVSLWTGLRSATRFAVVAVAIIYAALSLSRSAALVAHYGAPFKAYGVLGARIRERLNHERDFGSQGGEGVATVRVCVGKEWYRFPSHFFLPKGASLAFLESGFRGQLPQLFDVSNGTRGEPPNFNEVNAEQRDRYVDAHTCDFVVDLGVAMDVHHERENRFDPWHPGGGICEASWELIYSAPFLDAERTSFLARILLLPSHRHLPTRALLPYEVFEKVKTK